MRDRLRALLARGSWRTRAALIAGTAVVAAFVPLAVLLLGDGDQGLCGGSKREDFTCYQTYLEGIVRTQGGEAALAELATLSARDAYVLAICHPLAHAVGRAALVRYKTVTEASNHGDYTCWSGYYHGIYEKYMSRFDDQELLTVIPTICKRPADDPYAFDYYNCLHGLGHGVTIRFNNDPFQSLPFCDVFDEEWQRTSCYTGAFMQNIVVDRQMHQSVRLDPDDPVYPCDAVAHRYKAACYLTQTSYILRVYDFDYEKTFAVCDGVESEFVATCYRSMGRDISGNSHREADKVVELCSLGNPELQGQCYEGAARNAVFNDHATRNADELCAIVPERYRAGCEEARDDAAARL